MKTTPKPFLILATLSAGILFHGTLSAMPTPVSGYQRQATWEESVRISLEAVAACGAEARQIPGKVPDPHAAGKARREMLRKSAEIWNAVQRDFPASAHEMAAECRDDIWRLDWQSIGDLAKRYARLCPEPSRTVAERLARSAATPNDLAKVREIYRNGREVRDVAGRLAAVNPEAARLAVADLEKSYPGKYDAASSRKAIDAFVARRDVLSSELKSGKATPASLAEAKALVAGVRRALLANPVLDFGRLLVVERKLGAAEAESAMSAALGFPVGNSFSQDTIRHDGWDNSISVLSDLRGDGVLTTLYKPANDALVSDVNLHFNADRMTFTSVGVNKRWALFEMSADGKRVAEITPTNMPAVDFFGSCYLPDGHIAMTTTAAFQGLPCVNGGSVMAQLYLMDGQGDPNQRRIRQLTFEQDSDWCPTMLNNGRLMYLRWEYTDQTHYFSRILFHCNPDGTDQREYYHSNSYFPNVFFYARPIPGHGSQVVGIASGHHGISHSGRLLILDPALGRQDAEGVVQEIPGRGKKVEPIIKDPLVDGVWPQFTQPYPLSDPASGAGAGKYFVVSCKPTPKSLWGIYLVDVFDNITLIKEVEGSALLEPIPFRATPAPPVIPERINPERKDALVFLTNIYQGGGLKGVPRGEVKQLRLFSYYFAHLGRGGHKSVGEESGWDVKRILGTVPVESDGSAFFRIPANLPIAVQPLDKDGRALQLMRSWFVGMPGENLSCVGCHEKQNSTVPNTRSLAATRAPSEIEPWYGPARPFSYRYEVQPVLDHNCVKCHNAGNQLDLSGMKMAERGYDAEEYRKDKSYMNLQLYVRRPGPESDQHMFRPMEYHAGTSDLVQMLEKGHYGVKPSREDWERLAAWIDLNAPYRGSWKPGEWRGCQQDQMRREYAKRFANVETDPEGEYAALAGKAGAIPQLTPVTTQAKQAPVTVPEPTVDGWPFDKAKAAQMQTTGVSAEQTVALSGLDKQLSLKLKRIPEGRFVMGSNHGCPDEAPANKVDIPRAFWMSELEISNEIYHAFDPTHDSGFYDMPGKDHNTPGAPANGPGQPVVRVTWQEAMNFCQWLGAKTGRKFTLPTEAQWEWSCRAGTSTDLWYGGVTDDFSHYANLAGKESRVEQPYPGIDRVADGQAYPQRLGAYQANAWGLKDMHGGVAEWTRTSYKPYPYADGDGRNDLSPGSPKVARGGSWRSRPAWARSAFRSSYQSWEPLSFVGFRVVCEETANTPASAPASTPVKSQPSVPQTSGHRCLVSGCGAGAVTMVGKNGVIEWEYPITSECSDSWKLPNGNFFFSYKEGVREVKQDKTTVWEFQAPAGCEIQGCQPLDDNRFLVAESHKDGMTILYEMDDAKKIYKTVTINLGGGSHQQVRQIRKTPQGTYLACQQRGGGKAMEFDGGGKLLRSFPSGRYVAERLPDGNTLIACGDEHRVIEVDGHDKIVWEVNQSDIPGTMIGFAAGVVRLPNGNTIICNWTGHGGVSKDQPLAFEVTKDKKLVWELKNPKLKLISSIRILDEATMTPAKPAK